ncbi:winged helix-turn-helix transcriptional regulator [Candidatus Pacearchaeota archaeon]|nr:winged helix-turn-helix transcriptional regulator [Candidatus Pacearchaeota archaeon]MBD3282936.1 winged helix-turn-helix transcriptional regulator [Candidatus Pacearchaeota archaeon]
MKLDAYDKKILEILLGNSREPISSISKKIRLRRENTNYRINRLLKKRIIKGFNTIFNNELLNMDHYGVFLEMRNLNAETETKILQILEKDPYVTWMGVSAGKWSIVFDLMAPRNKDLDKILRAMLDKLGDFVINYVAQKIYDAEHYQQKIIGLRYVPKKQPDKKPKIKLDKIDWKIITLLNQNSRTSYVDIAVKTKLTPNAITNRIKNLEKAGYIYGYSITIDWKKFGYEWYGIQFKTNKFDKKTEEKITEYLRNHPRLIFSYKYVGGAWDYDVGIIVKNSNEIRDFINEFRSVFSKEIRITDVFIVLDQLTMYELPKGILDS